MQKILNIIKKGFRILIKYTKTQYLLFIIKKKLILSA